MASLQVTGKPHFSVHFNVLSRQLISYTSRVVSTMTSLHWKFAFAASRLIAAWQFDAVVSKGSTRHGRNCFICLRKASLFCKANVWGVMHLWG